MKKLMRQSPLWFMAMMPGLSVAVTPLQAIQSFPQLSTLLSYINASPNFTSLLTSANNFTLLAPSNDAFTAFVNQSGNFTSNGQLEANLQYSLLQGGFPQLSFSNTPQFVASNLHNATYSNVTGGQRVELVLGSDGSPEVISSNKSISTLTSADIICSGGIIHIINEVLTVPITTVLEITAAGLEYFISILNVGGYLNTADTYVETVLGLSDVTYFVPNTAAALGNATQLIANAPMAEQQAFFEYHIIPGFVAYSSLLTNGTQLKTATGSNVTVTVHDEDTYINGAKIIGFDYIVSNGVFHVIDSILNESSTSPPIFPISSTASTSTPAPTPTSSANPNSMASATTQPIHSSSSHTLSTGAKAGIGVGAGIAGLIILAVLAGFLLRSKKEKRESMAWGDQNMEGVPNDMGKYYVQRGTVQKQQDLGLGLQSTGMHDIEPAPEEWYAKGASAGSSAPSRPSVPPRSPSRLGSRNEFF